MLPTVLPSSTPMPADFVAPDDIQRTNLLEDFEQAGVDLNDTSEGLNFKPWRIWYDSGTSMVKLGTVDLAHTYDIFTASPTELTFTFDQNMKPAIAYMEGGVLRLRWFDAAVGANVTSEFTGTGPLLTLDDKRDQLLNNSDILLWYIRDEYVRYRAQSERYLVEHSYCPIPAIAERITNVGMNKGLRMQIYFNVLA